ncbi:hypothetical protein SAMN04488515_0249 [Cognatiyoonia koreensis]|uniref:Nucleoside-specific outer membrane channel protein Tsx n=1 Tax=Cognatiyoonia koreensis TaxID=364200 RepID=A0A1I0MU95_9RHOB|nr:hypothetical protein [Cognatiyoonia koreensis]SEV92363.1 hypothetical protein SAMN04488515_0249 [Cognatiyoonia koreensis]
MFRILVILIALLAGQPALSGAWAREKGEWFIAFGGNFWLSDGSELPVHYDPTLYAEFGLTDRITVGLDSHLADAGRIASDFIFFTVPVGDLEAQNRFAVGVGFGLRRTLHTPTNLATADFSYLRTEELLRGSVSWGRGYESGWYAVDASATLAVSENKWRPKADLTWGRHWNDHWTTTVQLQTGQGFTDDYYAKISPSVIYHWNDYFSISVGAVQGLTGDKGAGMKLETWITF